MCDLHRYTQLKGLISWGTAEVLLYPYKDNRWPTRSVSHFLIFHSQQTNSCSCLIYQTICAKLCLRGKIVKSFVSLCSSDGLLTASLII